MALYVYNTSDGSLVSWSPNDTDPVAPPAVLAANGLTKIVGLPPLDGTHAWNTVLKTVSVVVAPTPVNSIPLVNWFFRFTGAELAAIRASTDPNIQKFMFLAVLSNNQTIDVNMNIVQNAVNLMVSLGLLTAPRATVILS